MFIIPLTQPVIGRQLEDFSVRKDDITVRMREHDRETGAWGMASFQIPRIDLGDDPEASVVAHMVSAAGAFPNGLIVEDEDYPLAAARIEKKARALVLRDKKATSGLETPFGRFDTDIASQQKISGAVLMALIAAQSQQPFSVDWRLAGNGLVTLNATTMMQVGVLIGQHVAACQDRKNDLDAALDAATTLAEIEAVDVESGWPEPAATLVN